MKFSKITAAFTLAGNVLLTGRAKKGKLTVGHIAAPIHFDPRFHTVYSRTLRIFDASSTGTLALQLGSATASHPYVLPVAQVETATAAGTITLKGKATVTVTSAALAGSPIILSVAVSLGDTAAQWAAKVRTALTKHPLISAKFAVGGTSTAIRLTRLIDDAGVANDSTLNIALANGTCTGITPAASSANTTSGSVATGCIWDTTDDRDAEGEPLPTMDGLKAISLVAVRGYPAYSDSGDTLYGEMVAPAVNVYASNNGINSGTNLSISNNTSGVCEVIVTVVQAKA